MGAGAGGSGAGGCAGVARRPRRRRAHGSGALVLVALTVLTAACGSTVDLAEPSSQPPAGAGLQVAAPAGQPTGVAAPGTTTPVDGPSGPAAPAAPLGASAAAGVPALGSRSSVGPVAAVDGPGVTSSTITFGVPYATDTGQANAGIGAEGVDPGDLRDYYDVLVEEVNRTGGVAGRRLVPSYFQKQVVSTEGADAQWSAACEHWTRDEKAFVFFDANAETARSCAEKNGMLAFSGGGGAVAETFRRYPHYLEPTGIGFDSLGAATVEGLAETDYFGRSPVIGVVTWDAPNYRTAVADGYLPALARLGLRPKVVSYVKVPDTYQGAGSTGASVSSAVLRFQDEDVTHVLILDGPAGVALGTVITLAWIRAAGSQGYYPRYGFNDLNSPVDGLERGVWGPDDVRGSRHVTVLNHTDATDVGVAKNQARLGCLELMRRRGMNVDNADARGAMLRACDNVGFLRAVLGTERTTVNRDLFVALAERMGTRFRSPLAYRTAFSPTRHAGIAGFRRMALYDDCDCYRYTSGVYTR